MKLLPHAVFSNIPSLHVSSVQISPQYPVLKHLQSMLKGRGKAIHVTGRGGP
jgi:hypothetical protein